jgi:OOP family OmpA-OmpF porin
MGAGRITLNIAKPLLGAAIAAACVLPGIVAAQGTTTDAYATDSRGVVWKNPYGLCWRTSQWTPAKALAECDPDLVAKPVAAPPKPVPVPVPSPAPAPVAPLDADGDGVPDASDRCPGTPAGAKVNAQGCELDSDRDGVVDRLDKCPGTPAGAKVDAQGCELDSDRDGVVDRLDKCPGTRAGARVDANGCEIQEITVLKGVTFATNSATLTPQSMVILDETAAALARNPDLRAEVAGHTDSTGSAARNRVLSQQRAESVVRYLVSKGVNPANLTARGYGPDQPVADNRTAQGRSQNRRVELRILK